MKEIKTFYRTLQKQIATPI